MKLCTKKAPDVYVQVTINNRNLFLKSFHTKVSQKFMTAQTVQIVEEIFYDEQDNFVLNNLIQSVALQLNIIILKWK